MPTISSMKAIGWVDPNSKTFAARNIIVISSAGIKVSCNKELAKIFKHFLAELDVLTKGDLDKTRDDWGYANRNVRGSTSKSFHAWGLALDVNATINPMGPRATKFPEAATRALAHKYGLRWGLDYSGPRKDAMHFEFIGSLAAARHIASTLS